MSDRPERFRATSSVVMGVLGLILSLALAAIGLLDDTSGVALWVALAALFVAVLTWASMVRPVVQVHGDELVLRNMLDTVALPLAAVEQVSIGQMLAIGTASGRYVSPAVGKSWRKASKENRAAKAGRPAAGTTYADYVEERLSQLAEDARAREGVALMSSEQAALAQQVRRQPAWPEIGALVVTAVAALVAWLV